jgi:predicted O-methyltransferase YrrM
LENGLLLFESKKTGDYHEEMNAAVFENWFSDILPRLEEDPVVVMDNAPYHSRKLKKHSEYRNKKGRHSKLAWK